MEDMDPDTRRGRLRFPSSQRFETVEVGVPRHLIGTTDVDLALREPPGGLEQSFEGPIATVVRASRVEFDLGFEEERHLPVVSFGSPGGAGTTTATPPREIERGETRCRERLPVEDVWTIGQHDATVGFVIPEHPAVRDSIFVHTRP
jgi:hypothetical protein